LGSRPHMMRCMLTSNLAVDERFANGTATCLHCNYIPPTFETYWSATNVAVWSRYTGPAHGMASGRDGEQAQSSSGTRQTITRIGGTSPVLFFTVLASSSEAYHHDLLARFCKESSLSKSSMCPDLDYIDVTARQENLAVKGEPIMLQLPIVPAYRLPFLCLSIPPSRRKALHA